MKIRIELEIKDEDNHHWQIYCAGKLKIILNSYLNRLTKSLWKHLRLTMTNKWFVEDDHECYTCMFNIHNKVDNGYEQVKNNATAINGCALAIDNYDEIDIQVHKDLWTANSCVCPHYNAASIYRQEMSSFKEINDFKQIIEKEDFRDE